MGIWEEWGKENEGGRQRMDEREGKIEKGKEGFSGGMA